MSLVPLYSIAHVRYAGFNILPDFLDDDHYNLSNDAKLLYAYIQRKITLACISTSYLDENAVPYCYFSIDEVMKRIRCQRAKACELIRSLEDAGLISRVAEGKKRRIYLFVEESFLQYDEEVEEVIEEPVVPVDGLSESLSEPADNKQDAMMEAALDNRLKPVQKTNFSSVRKSNPSYTSNNIYNKYNNLHKPSSKKAIKDDDDFQTRQTQSFDSLFRNLNKDLIPCVNKNELSEFGAQVVDYIEQFAYSGITVLKINGVLYPKTEILNTFSTLTNRNLLELESNCSATIGRRVTNPLRYYLAALYNLLTAPEVLPPQNSGCHNRVIPFCDFEQRIYDSKELEDFFINEVAQMSTAVDEKELCT